jgi:hypothetical protein
MISYFIVLFLFWSIFELHNLYVAVGWVFMRIRVFPNSYSPWWCEGLPAHLLEMRTAATMLLVRCLRLKNRLTQNFRREFATSLARSTDSSTLNNKIWYLVRLGVLSNSVSFVRSGKENQRRLLQLVIRFKTTCWCLVENLLDIPILLA